MNRRDPTDVFTASSVAELETKLNEIPSDVPLRTEGRTTDHTELYCIKKILKSLPANRLPTPVRLVHRDRPDFSLHTVDQNMGIEITEAVDTNTAASNALRERGLGPETHFIKRSIPGMGRKKLKKLKQEIVSDKLGDGWEGDSAEREWAEAMSHYIDKKLKDSAKPQFEKFDPSWLVVYDNWELPHLDGEKSAGLLHEKLLELKAYNTFRSIFSLEKTGVFEFTSSGFTRHK